MKDTNASQLIAHIEEAEDWLHKARTEYHQANPIRGELILNLAQAEVKHAWELSRRQFVLKTSNNGNNRPHRSYLLPAAATLILILGLIFGGQLVRIMTNTLVANEAPKKPVKIAIKLNKAEIEKDLTPKPLATVNNQLEETVKTKMPDKVISKSPVNTVVYDDKSNDTRVTDSTQVQPRLQPVSQITIDEDALANEASRSLRNE